jgi:hypothetical protein
VSAGIVTFTFRTPWASLIAGAATIVKSDKQIDKLFAKAISLETTVC